MYADAHLHLVDLARRDPGFAGGIPSGGWTACVACHDGAEWEEQERLAVHLPAVLRSFGIHPQWPVWEYADFLARLAAERRIDAIGEAGFDFYGDRPERIRNGENERIQREVFEFQLGLAGRYDLPLILHVRKAMDLVFLYGRRLSALGPVVFHCYSGTAADIGSILRRGIDAYFSFGTPLAAGYRRSVTACASAPADRLLVETDAPWQPPRGSPWTGAGHIVSVLSAFADIRGIGADLARCLTADNFMRVFGSPTPSSSPSPGSGNPDAAAARTETDMPPSFPGAGIAG